MSRGLGSLQSWIIGVLAVDRHGAEVRVPDLVSGWAHWRAVAHGGRGSESCDCPGRCMLASRSNEVAVHRAVRAIEDKGLIVARLDLYGRKVVRLAEGPVTWRPGRGVDDADAGPELCAACGGRAAGWIIDRQRRRAALRQVATMGPAACDSGRGAGLKVHCDGCWGVLAGGGRSSCSWPFGHASHRISARSRKVKVTRSVPSGMT